jgi:hypothetical protein
LRKIFTERKEAESGRIIGDDASWREMRRGREWGRKKKGPYGRTGIRGRTSASLTFYSVLRAPARMTPFRSYVVWSHFRWII